MNIDEISCRQSPFPPAADWRYLPFSPVRTAPNAQGEYAAPGVETAQLVSVVVQEILEISVIPVGCGGNRRIGRLGP